MTTRATISFSQPGVQPPVYVVTSLSSPPWDILELHVDREQREGGDMIFSRSFENVGEGTYQYKIRIGEGHWVVDESKETATDEHGNKNNAIHVRPSKESRSSDTASQTPVKPVSETPQLTTTKANAPQNVRKDSTISDVSISPSNVPVPFVPIEKAYDKQQPEYGGNESESLKASPTKRAADAKPDSKERKAEIPVTQHKSSSPEVPLIIVEKTDDKPVHGDDLGSNATSTQKAAHEMRAADAEPDKVVIAGDAGHSGAEGESDAAPLLRHETAQTEVTQDPHSMDTILEASTESSTEAESISQRSEASQDSLKSEVPPLLAHEIETDGDDADELNHGPLLSHETGLNGNDVGYEDESDEEGEGDELDAAPLLSHEIVFSTHTRGVATSNSGYDRDEDSEPHGLPYDDDDDDEFDYGDDPENDAPLLPHERESATSSRPSSDFGDDLSLRYQTSFGSATDTARDLFGQSSTFRTRANSSTLPHRMPQSDAEDENLHDPSLEKFPTGRANILERVASIGLQLPEDQTMEDVIHSPVASVFSASTSSVENLSTLAPVRSYASLASVPEGDSDDDDAADIESLPSPVVLNFAKASSAYAHEDIETPRSEDNKRLGYAEAESSQTSSDGASDSAATKDIGKDDIAQKISSKVSEVANAATKAVEPIAQFLPSSSISTSITKDAERSSTDSQIRQRNVTNHRDTTSTAQPSSPADATISNITRTAVLAVSVLGMAWWAFA